MRRLYVVPISLLTLGFITAVSAPVTFAPSMAATTLPTLIEPPPTADAGLRDTWAQIGNEPKQAAGIGAPLAGEGDLESEERGIPSLFGHTEAGATAERQGEPAPVGVPVRRHHRAPSALLDIVIAVAAERGVPPHLLAGLAEDESTWRDKVHGKHGEQGLFQLKAGTADWCGGDVDRLDAFENADCAARYLYAQFVRFGSWELAFVAFKAGPETIPERIPAASWEFAQRALLKAEAYR